MSESDDGILNLMGAISYIGQIRTIVEGEVEHAKVTKEQFELAAQRMHIVARFMENLSGEIAAIPLSNEREQTAALSAEQVAASLKSVVPDCDANIEYYKSFLDLIDVVVDQMKKAQEGS